MNFFVKLIGATLAGVIAINWALRDFNPWGAMPEWKSKEDPKPKEPQP